MNYKADVLIFVEDPSVANYVASLPQALSDKGLRSEVYAAGIATDYLSQRKIPFRELTSGNTAGDILDSSQPRCLVVGTAENPDTIGLPLIAAARQKGIPTIGLVDATMNTERRFLGRTESPLSYAPDWVLVPDSPTKHAFAVLGFPESHVVICGHPQYDYVAELAAQWQQEDFTAFRQSVFPCAPAERQIVVFVGEGSARNKPLPESLLAKYTLKGRGYGQGRTEIVLEEFLDAVQTMNPKPYIVLRIHPKDLLADYAAYRDEIDVVSHGGSALDLIYASDIVVGMTSMLLTEAVLMGRKTLSIIPVSEEKVWLPSVRNGLTPCVTTREDLQVAIKKLLSERNLFEKPYSHESFVFGAVPRIISLIENILLDK